MGKGRRHRSSFVSAVRAGAHAGALAKSAYKYLTRLKMARFSDTGGSMDTYASNATNVQIIEPPDAVGGKVGYAYRNVKEKLKNKKGASHKMLQSIILNQLKTSIVSRYQYINTQSSVYNHDIAPANPGTYSLNKQWTDATAQHTWMPVYAINLTSPPITQGIGSFGTCPMYRLKKIYTAASDHLVHNYVWSNWSTDKFNSQNPNGNTTTVGTWQHERITANSSTNDYRTHDHYICEWADIKLNIQSLGAAKVRVSTVSFNNPYAGPIRQYLDGTTYKNWDSEETPANVAPAITEETSKADMWWDAYLSRRSVHPIRSVDPMVKSKAVKFHTSDCICITPEVQTDTHGGAIESLASSKREMFIPFRQLFQCTTAYLAEANHNPSINTLATMPGGVPVPTWNQYNTRLTQGGFPKRSQDVWLLISADDFSSTTNHDAIDNRAPWFDFVIRQKVTFSHI